jgi:ankyrin repeat protein
MFRLDMGVKNSFKCLAISGCLLSTDCLCWAYYYGSSCHGLYSYCDENTIDVNIRCGDNGDTPLHNAAKNDRVEVVRELLNRGADVNAKDGEGYRPFDVATSKEMKDLLRRNGGREWFLPAWWPL